MALVAYSDSEESDTEASATKSATSSSTSASKVTFQKVVDPSHPRRLKVDLPSVKPDLLDTDEAPPAKKARTGGNFSGFNSLLPAPKKASGQNAPKAGVSLKTSSEAAFSRAPPPRVEDEEHDGGTNDGIEAQNGEQIAAKIEEPKIVGKATKFKPLSVANKKKSKTRTVGSKEPQPAVQSELHEKAANKVIQEPEPAHPKPRRALFSLPEEEEAPKQDVQNGYQPMTHNPAEADDPHGLAIQQSQQPINTSNPNSLQSLTSDLGLTRAQQRQLFGRHFKDGDVHMTHFNMESEYAANEQLRQAGEVVEHRAVKAIAPGKHSLQQLVNNARSQQEAMEDKWSQGKNDRGEGGAKYGWSR